jgi:hypothetical protein
MCEEDVQRVGVICLPNVSNHSAASNIVHGGE